MAGYIGTIPVPQATQTRETFTATANQTSFATGGYTPNFIDVFMNGVKLAPADFTATNGSDVVLASGAAANDIIDIVAFTAFQVLNQNFTGNTSTQDLTVSGNLTVTGSTITIDTATVQNVDLGDNDKIRLGDGDDLQLYHSGSFSLIQENGTGNLIVAAGDLQITNSATTENMLRAYENGAVELYHDNTKKFETTATGVDVTGKATLTSGELTFSGSISNPQGAAYIFRPSDNTMAFGTANTERMRIDSSGNVGIGHVSPTAILDVRRGDASGKIAEFHTSTGFGIELGSSQSDAYVQAGSSQALLFNTNGSNERMRIDSSGRLLIGTTTEGSAEADTLTIAETGNAGMTIRSGSSNSGTIFFSDATSGAGEYAGVIQYNHSSNYMRFSTSGSERMRINSAGNALIGSGTAPTGFARMSLVGGESSGSGANSGIQITYNSGAYGGGAITTVGAAGGGLDFYTFTGNVGSESYLHRMRIDSSGNLLVGRTTTPSASGAKIAALGSGDTAVQVTKSGVVAGRMSAVTTGLAFGVDTSDGATERMRIDSNGNVGIGTSVVPNKFTVSEGTNQHGVEIVPGTLSYIQAYDRATMDYGNLRIDGQIITFGTNNGAERMRVDANGIFMVGKTAADGGVVGFEARANGETFTTKSSGNTLFVHDTSSNKFYVNANGGIYNYQSNNVNLSDEREKKNIGLLGSKWDAVKKWSIKEFHYNSDADSDSKKLGVIAQDLETNHPELIADYQKTDDETRKSVKEQQMMWMAIKALQEAMAKIEVLETKVAALEAE